MADMFKKYFLLLCTLVCIAPATTAMHTTQQIHQHTFSLAPINKALEKNLDDFDRAQEEIYLNEKNQPFFVDRKGKCVRLTLDRADQLERLIESVLNATSLNLMELNHTIDLLNKTNDTIYFTWLKHNHPLQALALCRKMISITQPNFTGHYQLRLINCVLKKNLTMLTNKSTDSGTIPLTLKQADNLNFVLNEIKHKNGHNLNELATAVTLLDQTEHTLYFQWLEKKHPHYANFLDKKITNLTCQSLKLLNDRKIQLEQRAQKIQTLQRSQNDKQMLVAKLQQPICNKNVHDRENYVIQEKKHHNYLQERGPLNSPLILPRKAQECF